MTPTNRSQQAAITLWSGMIVATAVLLSRRATGDLTVLTTDWPCILVSSVVTVLGMSGWTLFRQSSRLTVTRGGAGDRIEWVVAAVTWIPAWLSGLALAPTNSAIATGWLLGVAMLNASVLALTGTWHRPAALVRRTAIENETLSGEPQSVSPRMETIPGEPQDVSPRMVSQFLDQTPAAPARVSPADASLSVFPPDSASEGDGCTTQWMTRQSLADGGEQVEGAVRVSCNAGQRSAAVHVPFSPPFAAVPQVECETDGDEIRCKVAAVYAYGMRIELKRGSSLLAAEYEVSYSAVCEPAAMDAA